MDNNGWDWRKSSRSNGSGECVEVGRTPEGIGIRDTKQGGRGPVLAFSAGDWRSFIATFQD
jgi:hypothetical protein